MSLVPILDTLVARLTAALPAGTRVGDARPASDVDLPTVTLAFSELQQVLVGVGRIPRATRRGALAVNVVIDLANPVLELGGGESLPLLSPDRRTVTLPHGPVVRVDGVEDPPFGDGDVVATDPGPFAVVAGTPTGRQVRVDPSLGTLEFGIALAPTGSLRVSYFIGQWDVTVTRNQGVLTVEIAAEDLADLGAITRQVALELDAADGVMRVTPSSWGASSPAELAPNTDLRSQTLGFRFDAELEEPVLTSGGGVISRVAITGRLTQNDLVAGPFDGTEEFDVTREGSTI